MFKDAWDQRQEQASATLHDVRKESRKLDKQIEGLLDRIVTTKSESVISAYEKRIEKLEREKMVLNEKLENKAKPVHSFAEMFELSLKFISNPWNIWASGQLSLKRTVLKLAFSERIAYSRKTGLRTPQVSVPFEFFGGHIEKCEMVHPSRFERETSAFGGHLFHAVSWLVRRLIAIGTDTGHLSTVISAPGDRYGRSGVNRV